MPTSSYDALAYRSRPVPWAAPSALALTSLAHGGPSLALDGPLRVLELGAGDGAHAIPLAFFHPDWHLHAVDTSERAAEAVAACPLELPNLGFELADVATFEAPAPFDVVIAHGLYSWVDAERRAAIRRLVSSALRDGGLAYVSFDAQPGWAVRGRVRDALVRGGADLPMARERLAGLAALVREPVGAWEPLLAHELERARDADDGYLRHEYLGPDNEAFWLGDVVRAFAEAGLTYVGDATFDRVEGFVPPALRDAVAPIAADTIHREELLDLRLFRQLRAAVFTRGATGEAPSPAALVEQARVACAARRRNDPFDPRPGVVERFDGPGGAELRVEDAALKIALLVLADRYPEGLALDALRRRCVERLREVGLEPSTASLEALGERLGRLFTEIQCELRLEAPRLRCEPGDRPRATALTRWEASTRGVLTTPLHTLLPHEPIDAAIVTRLDGSRTRDAVADEVARGVADGGIPLEGAPAGLSRIAPWVRARVDTAVTTLGWWGLCE